MLLLAPTGFEIIYCALKIRLKDLASVCFLGSSDLAILTDLRASCLRKASAFRAYPLYLLNSIIESATELIESRSNGLLAQVQSVEGTTGMSPWNRFPLENTVASFDGFRLRNFLKSLHAINMSLRLNLTCLQSAANLGPSFRSTAEKIEMARAQINAPAILSGQRDQFEDQVRFNETRLQGLADLTTQLLGRVNAQINVVRRAKHTLRF